MARALEVSLPGQIVGVLEYFEDEEAYVFAFDEGYLRRWDRPTLGQLFEERRPERIETTGMISWFANLLPQRLWREFAAGANGLDPNDDFGLLEALGADLPGAVTAKPTKPRLSAPKSNARRQAQGSPSLHLPFSLAGAQLKLSVRESPRGLVVPVDGQSGVWIAKFDDRTFPDLPRIEYATMQWALRSGLETPETRLVSTEAFEHLPGELYTGNGSVFLVRRFDRAGPPHEERIHMEDFGQILDRAPGNDQYRGTLEDVALVLNYLSHDQVFALVSGIVFSIISGNGDTHLKNWSVQYADGRSAKLSPLYDQVSTIHYIRHRKLAMPLFDATDFDSVRLRHFEVLADLCKIERAAIRRTVAETTRRAMEAFGQTRDLWSAEEWLRLQEHLKGLSLPGECI